MVELSLISKVIQKSKIKKLIKVTLGWREWCSLPDLAIAKVKCKVDTGAKTSSLHAYDVELVRKHGQEYVSFKIHPLQRNTKRVEQCTSKLLEWRQVTDSGGRRTLRPVIVTSIKIGSITKLIEITLIARDEMGFRMLLGREALKKTWIVDPARSFIASKKPKKPKILN
jgi:hypothetical protein